MSRGKSILVITHSNNDLDHFIPLFIEFKKDKTKDFVALAFYNKDELFKNRLHKFMCKENDIELQSFTDMFGLQPLSSFMVRLYNYSSAKVKKIRYTGNIFNKNKKRLKDFFSSPHDSFVRMMYFLSKKYIVFYTLFLTKHKHIEKYFLDNNFSLAIIDIRTEEIEDLNLKPLQKLKKITKREMRTLNDIMFRFLDVAREKKIPILEIPHGPNYLTEKPIELAFKDYKSPFRADYTIHCNITGQKRDKAILGLKKPLLLGDPRYDPKWIEYFESCAVKLYKGEVEKPKDKKILLYVASYLQRNTYQIDADYHQEIHKDILSLVNYFPEVEIWMKYHPRLVFKVPIEEYVSSDKQQNIKFLGNEVDTSVLMAMADMVVSPMSSTLTIPILQKKPLIYYKRWKEKTGGITVTTVYDQCPFVLKAANHNELKHQLETVLHKKGYKITDSDVAFFYKKMFSADSPSENMTKKYMKTINNILLNKL